MVSTFARDVQRFAGGRTLTTEGGPALFISRFLTRSNVPFTLVTGTPAVVEIDMRGGAERGVIKRVGKIRQDVPAGAGLVIISTVLDEFPLRRRGAMCCLDVQGYVRDKDCRGQKRVFSSDELARFDIIKGTMEELRYLPLHVLQRVPVVVATDGARGFQVTSEGETRRFAVEPVSPPDTIGAGDTFFAAFCLSYYRTRDVVASAVFASRTATEFLREKCSRECQQKEISQKEERS